MRTPPDRFGPTASLSVLRHVIMQSNWFARPFLLFFCGKHYINWFQWSYSLCWPLRRGSGEFVLFGAENQINHKYFSTFTVRQIWLSIRCHYYSLNPRWGCNKRKLFSGKHHLNWICWITRTKYIKVVSKLWKVITNKRNYNFMWIS